VAHAPLASEKPTHFGRETDRFNLFINPKALGLVACPSWQPVVPAPRCLLNKAGLLDFFLRSSAVRGCRSVCLIR